MRKVVRHIVGPAWGICEEEMIFSSRLSLTRERDREREGGKGARLIEMAPSRAMRRLTRDKNKKVRNNHGESQRL